MNTLNNRTNLVVQQSLRSSTPQLKASRDIMYFNTENLISQIIFKTWPDFNNQANQSSVVLRECFFYLTTYKWLGFMPRKESAVAKEHEGQIFQDLVVWQLPSHHCSSCKELKFISVKSRITLLCGYTLYGGFVGTVPTFGNIYF